MFKWTIRRDNPGKLFTKQISKKTLFWSLFLMCTYQKYFFRSVISIKLWLLIIIRKNSIKIKKRVFFVFWSWDYNTCPKLQGWFGFSKNRSKSLHPNMYFDIDQWTIWRGVNNFAKYNSYFTKEQLKCGQFRLKSEFRLVRLQLKPVARVFPTHEIYKKMW